MKRGITNLSSELLDGSPGLAVAGPNVGSNLGLTVHVSGTVGAATYAAGEGIPAIAFSGSDGEPTAWDAEVPTYSTVYADLATKLVERVVQAGTPYLPDDVFLNVNFPSVDGCSNVDDYSYVLSRIFTAVPLITDDDVETCGDNRLPTERSVVDTDGCYVSVSVGKSDKSDANATVQQQVLDKLGDLLTCLPS